MGRKRHTLEVALPDDLKYLALLNAAEIGNRLFKVRHVYGMGGAREQRAFAKKFHFNSGSWNHWEVGNHVIPPHNVAKLIFDVYEGLTFDYIYLGRLSGMVPEVRKPLEEAPDRPERLRSRK